jgi:hypothetical protein
MGSDVNVKIIGYDHETATNRVQQPIFVPFFPFTPNAPNRFKTPGTHKFSVCCARTLATPSTPSDLLGRTYFALMILLAEPTVQARAHSPIWQPTLQIQAYPCNGSAPWPVSRICGDDSAFLEAFSNGGGSASHAENKARRKEASAQKQRIRLAKRDDATRENSQGARCSSDEYEL